MPYFQGAFVVECIHVDKYEGLHSKDISRAFVIVNGTSPISRELLGIWKILANYQEINGYNSMKSAKHRNY